MNKKKYITFGVIGLFAMALITAGLVGYLSNPITGTVEVVSPLVLTVTGITNSLGYSANSFTIPSAESFNEQTIYFTLENKANTAIEAIVEIEISGDDGSKVWFSIDDVGEEFDVLKIGMFLSDTECGLAGGVWNDYGDEYCYWDASVDKAYSGVEGGNYYVQMGDRNAPNPIPANAKMFGGLKVQFNLNVAPATYTFNTQALTVADAKDLI